MDREPLYQRLERLTRNRRLYVASLWAIGAVVVAVPVAIMVWTGVQFGNPFVSGFAAYIAVVLGGGLLIRRSLERRFGREQRTRTATRLSSKTRWPALNRALSDYAVRAGVEPPRVSYYPRAASGDEIDAELAFAGDPEPGGSRWTYRSVLEALPGDSPAIAFSEAMLDTYSAEELLAVVAHLMARAAILRKGVAGSNGAREADSQALLLTHDHVSLLRALEKCTKFGYTRPPGFGFVHFSDADLHVRTTLEEDQPEWVSHDRIAELRSHLMAAGLDVPEGHRPWPKAPEPKPAPPWMQAIFGVGLLVVAVACFAGLTYMLVPELKLVAAYPEFVGDLWDLVPPGGMLIVLATVFTHFGVRMLLGARRVWARQPG